ncbi:SH3 domain-containing protein [Simiduia sp. 21SJ11W-1]|uniref:SH3 domain-containing protein n=1 Tax=Simiduia sp. 21SJ11W-1 TaxID=2909669 RepID=UPI0020A16018|nr:SH3 domain-containing protein [Simiduia sp. 21SJ11W-1]UTA48400.1 SH3 domain-containing protein [Simiduia sp. 21SJ11W-1]
MINAGRAMLGALVVFSLLACNAQPGRAATESTAFSTDVPDISEPMLEVNFWLERLQADGQVMSEAEVAQFNAALFANNPHMHSILRWPDKLTAQQVSNLINSVSRAASSPRYFADGTPVSAEVYARWQAAANSQGLSGEVPVRWGMVVARAHMRSFPTDEKIFKQPNDLDLDRLQETGVFPGQPLALLHESADGNWWFAVNYHYAAWLPKWAVATASKAQLKDFEAAHPRLLVTGAQVHTNFNPVDARSSQVALDMGVSLPLLSAAQVNHNVHGQNPFASYVVQLPVRTADGQLSLTPTLIARSRDVHVGHLPFTRANVLRQAFKFLGERYGWGHDYNGRDCTGFVGEVYKSFGLLMPRNSGQQGESEFAEKWDLATASRAEKLDALARMQVGDLIYIPGHVMMYIGSVNNAPYVIHDVTGMSYFDGRGDLYQGRLSGVSVTPLLPLRLSAERDFIDSIYAIKAIR